MNQRLKVAEAEVQSNYRLLRNFEEALQPMEHAEARIILNRIDIQDDVDHDN